MGFFDSIKNAFHHPIDVNIISGLSFRSSDATIPIQLEIINKEPDKQFIVTEILTTLTKTPEQKPNEPPQSSREMFRESQQVNIVVPANGTTQIYNFEVHNTGVGFMAEAAERVLPDNPLVQGILSMAGKAEEMGNVLDSMNEYTYNLRVELLDTDGLRGYDDRRVNILAPGEVGGTTTAWHS